MARKTKQGLDYFPFDVNFFEDDKLQFVSARFGCKGENITIKLLCKIYSDKGYFYKWGEDESLLFAKRAGFEVTLVNDVMNELIKREFFNKDIFNSFGVLTSKGIQERYFEAAKRKKKDGVIQEYIINETNKVLIVTNKPLNDAESTQRKEKESKVNESKVDEIPTTTFEYVSDEILNSQKWIEETAIHFKKSIDEIENFLDDFLGKIKLQNDWHKGISEVKKHFINSLNKKIETEKVAQKNGKQTNFDNLTTAYNGIQD